MDSKLSVIVVTSPARSHPSTFLLDSVLKSFDLVQGLENATITIIFDHYFICDKAQPKKGKVTAMMAENYEAYITATRAKYGEDKRFAFIICENHHGFAMCVKRGLESCVTKYCLVCQHDRAFMANIPGGLPQLLDTLERTEATRPLFAPIRYIGLPTSSSCHHDSLVRTRYRLDALLQPPLDVATGDKSTVLRPLVFMYDSNHIAIVEEYLKIFQPYKNLPETLRSAIGIQSIRAMLLKKGDFIEDRFGQQERNLLTDQVYSDDTAQLGPQTKRELFLWFGTYLLMSPHMGNTKPIVYHLRGRRYTTEYDMGVTLRPTRPAHLEDNVSDNDEAAATASDLAIWPLLGM